MSKHTFAHLPIMAAPMAGGPSSPALVTAVGHARGFAWVAAGYKTPEALAAEIVSARDAGHPFGVNLFVPSEGGADRAAFAAYAEQLRPEAEALGLDPTEALNVEPFADRDHWDEKLEMLIQDPVPYASFTFGLPEAHEIARLKRTGTAVFATVTTPDEALAAETAGVDGLIAQGPGRVGTRRRGIHSGGSGTTPRPGSSPRCARKRACRLLRREA